MRNMPLLILLATFSLAAQAQVYKWTDGKVHYSDQAVGKGQPVHLPASPPADPAAGTRLQELRNQLNGNQLNREEDKLKSQKQAGELQSQCSKVQDRLKGFEDHARIAQEKDGERVYLDAARKDALMAEMRSFLKENCQ